jgi:hypothetical protein
MGKHFLIFRPSGKLKKFVSDLILITQKAVKWFLFDIKLQNKQ